MGTTLNRSLLASVCWLCGFWCGTRYGFAEPAEHQGRRLAGAGRATVTSSSTAKDLAMLLRIDASALREELPRDAIAWLSSQPPLSSRHGVNGGSQNGGSQKSLLWVEAFHRLLHLLVERTRALPLMVSEGGRNAGWGRPGLEQQVATGLHHIRRLGLNDRSCIGRRFVLRFLEMQANTHRHALKAQARLERRRVRCLAWDNTLYVLSRQSHTAHRSGKHIMGARLQIALRLLLHVHARYIGQLPLCEENVRLVYAPGANSIALGRTIRGDILDLTTRLPGLRGTFDFIQCTQVCCAAHAPLHLVGLARFRPPGSKHTEGARGLWRHHTHDPHTPFSSLWQVFEHVRQPHVAAATLAALLRPGGVVVWTAPFLERFHLSPTDFFRFTVEGGKALLEDAGLAVVAAARGGDSLLTLGSLLGYGATDFDLDGHGAYTSVGLTPPNTSAPSWEARTLNADPARWLYIGSGVVGMKPRSADVASGSADEDSRDWRQSPRLLRTRRPRAKAKPKA